MQVASPVPEIQHTPMPFGSPVPYPTHDASPAQRVALPSQQHCPPMHGNGKGAADETGKALPRQPITLW